MRYVATQAELAKELGRVQSTISHLKRKGCPVKKTKRGYAVEPVEKWIRENLTTKADRASPTTAARDRIDAYSLRQELIREQIRERAATAELKELQVKLDRGDLIPREDVEAEEKAKVGIVRRGLLNLPRSVAPLLVGLEHREIEALLTKKIRELLQRFAKS